MSAATRRWHYAAEDAAGAVVAGVIDAADRVAAVEALKSRRLIPLSLKEARGQFVFGRSPGGASDALSLPELARLTARLRDLLTAGIPAAHALRLAAEQATRRRERAFLRDIRAEIESGRSLTMALARSRFEAPQLMKALVEAGEALGDLGRQFERLAAHYDEALKLRREMIAQLAYPAALFLLVIATLFFLSFFVLPQFEGIFETAEAPPPPETRFVLAAGALIRQYWPYAPLILLALLSAARFAARRYAGAWERLQLSAPVTGGLRRNADYGACLRTLAILLDGGAPLARAMPLARQAMSMSVLKAEIEDAEASVRVGERLSASMRGRTSCPKELISFIEIGEETGALAAMTGEAAKGAEERVRSSLRRMLTLLAPAMTALMGLITAGVIAAVMTGVLSLNDTIY